MTEFVNLESKWGRLVDSVQIPTWTERATLSFLAELASKSERIIECGTYLGASAKVMLLANPKLNLCCIDTFECRNEPMMLQYLRQRGVMTPLLESLTTFDICRHYTLRDEFNAGRCTLFKGDSETAVNGLVQFVHGNGTKAEAIWIDDGHAEEDVLRDIRCLLPFLKVGGEMVGHDFDVPHNDVARGVIASGISYDVPIPRMWRHIKKAEDVITVETGYPM